MTSQFSASSTTDDVIAGIRLDGKTAVVTGGSAGLGIETGRTLAAAGAQVVMVGRDAAKLEAAVASAAASLASASCNSSAASSSDSSPERRRRRSSW